MVTLTRLHGSGSFVVNADLIETIEARPDTTITLITKRKFVVENTVEEVVRMVIDYHQQTVSGANGTIRVALELDELEASASDQRPPKAA